MSRADVDALPEMVGAIVGGVRAAVEFGEHFASADNLDLYLSAHSFAGLDERVAYVPDAAGRVALRVFDDRAWGLLSKRVLAPRAAVELDLLESGDPRRWISAEHLVHRNG